MFLSIIIPAYNVEQYVVECIESIPTFENFDIEIIVIDDGSTDSTAEIVTNLKSVDNRIKLYSYENGGLSVARNRGMEKVTGQYVLFLDSDDSLDGKELLLSLEEIYKNDIDCYFISATNYYDSYFNGQQLEKHEDRYIRDSSYLSDVVSCRDTFIDYIKKRKYIVSACMYIVKVSFIGGLRFEEGIYYEDNIFTTKLMLSNDGRVITTLRPVYLRRVRNDSITTRAINKKNITDLLFCYKELLVYRESYCPSFCAKYLDVFLLSLIKNTLSMLVSDNDLNFKDNMRLRYVILVLILKRPLLGGSIKYFSIIVAIIFGVIL